MKLHATVQLVTGRIRARSQATRHPYLQRVDLAGKRPPEVERMGCVKVAHALAAMPASDKSAALARKDSRRIMPMRAPNIAIVTAYNDMLSAHVPLQHYPDLIKSEARNFGATAQVAGGVPAMCDGVTQGTAGMKLSMYSRDVIAMATAIALSHDMFDARWCWACATRSCRDCWSALCSSAICRPCSCRPTP